MESYVFWPVAVVSLVSAILVIYSANAVHSALALVANFFMLAVMYVLLDAHFLAAVQVIVYAGAIMVLFLFVIMLLGVDRQEDLRERLPLQKPLALLFTAGLAGLTVFTVRAAFQERAFPTGGLEQANQSGNVEGLGRLLFTKYLFPFEVTSLLLIIAAIGAMVIAKSRRPDQMDSEDDEA
ncbi:MAG TPA: NADH-quinone oxidoreductase subunit J [Actinomycetota bacterium]|nr:NADH-quinone oxidoreductase subunit J [Actinomycetota bacterium]